MDNQLHLHKYLWLLSAVVSWDDNSIKWTSKNLPMILWERFLFMYVLLGNVSQLTDMLIVLPDISKFSHNAGVTLLCLTMVSKVYRIIFYKSKIKDLLHTVQIAETRSLNRNEKEINIFMRAIERNWLIAKTYGVLVGIAVFGYMSTKLLEYIFGEAKKENCYKVELMYKAWFPLDKCKSYNFIYGFEIGFTLLISYYIFTIESFIIGITRFIIGQFQLLQIGIKDLLRNTTKKSEDDLCDVYEEVIEIIEHHLRIIKLVEELNRYLYPNTIIQFTLCALIFCAVIFEAIMSAASVQLILSSLNLTVALVQLFIFYWHANEISYQSTNVGTCVLESDWYQFSDRSKKALLLLIIRAQKPIQLTIGGYYPVSIKTFLMILKGTYSFFALFREL